MPAAPTALRTTAVAATSVALAWTDNAGNESGYQVLRNGIVIATLAVTFSLGLGDTWRDFRAGAQPRRSSPR